jgi:hypothetical protein
MAIKEDTLKSTPYLKGWGILKLISISTFEQIKDAGFKQIPVVISPNSSWSGHRPDLIRQLAQSIAA